MRARANIRNYIDFLLDLVKNKDHDLLLRQLHDIRFYSLVPNDENRGVDGKGIYKLYLDSVGPNKDPQFCERGSDDECSVLEMIIGVAYRIEFALFGSHFEKDMPACFWLLIDNLGLLDMWNYNYKSESKTKEKVDDIVEKLLNRQYEYNGEGGLFPLENPDKDQRKVEIWYQMSSYLLENYDF